MSYNSEGGLEPRRVRSGAWGNPPEWEHDAHVRTRNVAEMRIVDLLGAQAVAVPRPHRRRTPVVIDGVPVTENLRQRLTREKFELEEAVTQLAGQLARRTQQLEHLDRYPAADPFENGDVLQFDRKFPASDASYSYVAHKADERWYLTGGRSPQGVTWDELVSFMGLGVTEVWKLGGRGGRKKVIG